MKAFKAREVRKPVIEHLITAGYKLEVNLEDLVDSPYIIAVNGILIPVTSVSFYKESQEDELNEIQLLKIQPEHEVKKEDIVYKFASKLVKYLNSNKVKCSGGYDQIFTVQKSPFDMLTNKWEVLPISPNACGSIPSEKMKLIMDWMDKNYPPHLGFSFGYTDYNENKKRYGTSRPSIRLY